MDLRAGDVLYTPGEWSWAGPLYGYLLGGLYYGTPIVGDAEPGFDPERTLELVERYDVVSLAAPTTAYRAMMQIPDVEERFDLSSLRVAFEGGEALGQTVVEWFEDVASAAVHEGYGQTEANMLVGDCTALTEFREGAIGPPAPGHDVRILGLDSTEEVGPGETGEIAVRYEGNPVCFKEYWNKPEKTAAKVTDGWLRTEDLGSVDEDGYVTFLGRTDGVIISAGYRIGPVEIEEALASHAAVADAGVIGVLDDERGEVPKAFVVPAAGVEGDDDLRASLRRHVRDRLAQYEYPREIEFVEDLPKTSTGKVRRASLREREGLQ
jgi:acetyl-CoA synthetase